MKKILTALCCTLLFFILSVQIYAANAVPKEVLQASDAVVRVIAEYEDGYAYGSGFLVQNNADGIFVVTNYHVVEDEPLAIDILIGEAEVTAEIDAFSRQRDLCILSLPYALSVEPVTFGAEDAEQGDAVYAVGFPAAADDLSDTLTHGSGSATITDGIVSALRSATTSEDGMPVKLLQINAAINPGNSGGPLFDEDGYVVGINTYGAYDSQGIFGAICVSELKDFLAMTGITPTVSARSSHPVIIVALLAAAFFALLGVTAVLLIRRRKRNAAPPAPDNVTHLHIVRADEPAEEKTPRHKKKGLSKRVVPALCAVLAVVLLALAGGGYLYTYRQAAALAEDSRFAAALNALPAPGLTRLHNAAFVCYLEAGALLEDGQYPEAQAAFEALGDYRDAQELAREAQYQYAVSLIAQNDYQAAIELFDELAEAGYRDAADLLQEAKYHEAEYMILVLGDAESAYDRFCALANAGIAGAEDMAQYCSACLLVEKGQDLAAYRILKKLTDLEVADALREHLAAGIYKDAINQYHSGERTESERLFKLITPYMDSEKYLILLGTDVEKIKGIFEFDDAADALLSYSGLACQFLSGTWTSSDNKYYLTVSEWMTYDSNLPGQIIGDSFSVNYGVFTSYDLDEYLSNWGVNMYGEVTATAKEKKLFKITAVTPDCIDIYCYADGSIYTLYRQ